MAVPGWADDELIFDGCCCSVEDAKSTSTSTRGRVLGSKRREASSSGGKRR